MTEPPAKAAVTIRKATPDDIPAVERCMRESIRVIGSRSYTPEQVESTLRYTGRLDPQLVADGTYFVAESDGEIVGCGGWSRRGKLYAGSAARPDDDRLLDPATEPARIRAMFVDPRYERRGIGREILRRSEEAARVEGFRILELMAMKSGEAMYAACGYEPVEPWDAVLQDGVILDGTVMRKRIE